MAINAHLQQVMPPLLALASSEGSAPGPVAAREAINKIVAAVAEDGLYLLIAQVAAVLRSDLPCAELQDTFAHMSVEYALCFACEPGHADL